MYTGEMIETLIEKVQSAEAMALVRITQAKRPAHARVGFNTFIYEFGRGSEFDNNNRHTIEVA